MLPVDAFEMRKSLVSPFDGKSEITTPSQFSDLRSLFIDGYVGYVIA